jgi:hypothetical protein
MLRAIQDNLQAVYRVSAPDVRRFLIDHDQLTEAIGALNREADEWVLVRESPEGLDVAVYVAAAALERLRPLSGPSEAIDDAFPAFCLATEGVSHFMMLFERARRQEPVSMLELEAQAEVDKFIFAALHHPERTTEWHTRLFRDSCLAQGLCAAERARYTEAARLASAFCEQLCAAPHTGALLELLRTFWRASGAQRMDQMRRLAA